MIGRQLGTLLAALGLAAGLILAALPQSYRTLDTHQSVQCGNAVMPKNPPAPAETDDQCDAAHVTRAGLIAIVVFGGVLAGGVVFLVFRTGNPTRAA